MKGLEIFMRQLLFKRNNTQSVSVIWNELYVDLRKSEDLCWVALPRV